LLPLLAAGPRLPAGQEPQPHVVGVDNTVPVRRDSFPTGFVEAGGGVYFGARNVLWRTDGTEAGTLPVEEIPPQSPSGDERPCTIYKTAAGTSSLCYATDFPANEGSFD